MICPALPCSLLETLDETTRSAWDSFVKTCSPPHFEQALAWARARETTGWKPSALLIREGTAIQGGAQILSRHTRGLGRIGYISHGPLFRGQLQKEPGFIAARLKQAARQQRLFYLAVDLPYYEEALAPALKAEGFRLHFKHLPPSGLPPATLLLDLKPDLEALLAQMRSTTRYEIRRGVKLGVTVRQGTRADLGLFWQLLVELCKRRRATPNVAGLPFLNALWDGFSAGGKIDLLVAELKGSPVYALILLGFGNWRWAWRVGANEICAKCHGAQVTYWEAIKLAKTQGAETFDLLGIYPAPDGTIVDTPTCEGNPLQGITFFKLGFGGKPLHLPGTFGLFPNPLLRFLLKIGGEKLARTRLVQKVLAKGRRREV